MTHDKPLNVSSPQMLDLLLSRRSGSAKAMKGPGPSDAQIKTMITAASRVPDHGKLAPWRFLIIKGEARTALGHIAVRALKAAEPDASEERRALEQRRFERAPVVIAVVSRVREGIPIPEWEQILSSGAACQTLCLAAHALGFVANWLTEWPAYDPQVREALGLHVGERIAGFIYLGHPVEPLVDRPRPNLDDITEEWRPK